MPRARTPAALIPFSPGMKKNPSRRKGRENAPIPKGKIGKPPSSLAPDESAIWKQFTRECPPGVLSSSDRMALENFCRIQARIRSGRPQQGDEAQARIWMQQFGMTPAARSNVQVKQGENGNEFASV